jgi:phosphonatase-like hydrolase
MNIELAVFDMAGTTVRDDDAVHRCLAAALEAAGTRATRDEINEVMGIAKPVAIASLLARNGSASPAPLALVDQIHANFLKRMITFYESDANVEPMPGTMECFGRLKSAGIKVALDTGFSHDIVAVILRRLGWTLPGLLAAAVASDEVSRGRPHPDLLLEAMRRAGVRDVQKVIKVGDTPSDLGEGTSAGCAMVIGVTNGSHTRAQLAAHPHTHLISNLSELAPLLTSN